MFKHIEENNRNNILASQAEGRGFDPRFPLDKNQQVINGLIFSILALCKLPNGTSFLISIYYEFIFPGKRYEK